MKNLFWVFIISCTFTLSACFDNDADINGIYEAKKPNFMIIPLEENENCTAPFRLDETGNCIEDFESIDMLALYKQTPTSLLFSINASFTSGHSCSIAGLAEKVDTGWIYASMNELDDQESTYDDCEIKLTQKSNSFMINTTAQGPCRMYCGMRGDLNGLSFPISSRKNSELSENHVKCLGLFEDAQDCDQYSSDINGAL